MAEKVPSWFERLLLPQISEIKGDIKAFRGEMQGELGEMRGDLKAINTRIDALATEVKDLRENINMAQRVAVLEAEIRELKKK